MSDVVKFPYSVSRRAHARKPRWSKNGTPEERAAKAAAAAPTTDATVIELSRPNIGGTAPARARREKRKSQYELYPMPFFKVAKRGGRHSTWNVQSTGSYTRDYELGRTYAREFLASCDGSEGWCSLLSQITADMIRAGTNEVDGLGDPAVNGIVLGFMREIGVMLAAYTMSWNPPMPAS